MLHAMIMAGGGGTRFWPRSRQRRPKQFLTMAGNRSLLQMALDRFSALVPPQRSWIITSAAHCQEVYQQLPSLPQDQVVGEPCGRDTTACVALGAALVAREDPEAVLAVTPADHIISPDRDFQRAIEVAELTAQANPTSLVTFGITPTFPATGYGYIHRGSALGSPQGVSVYQVQAFREKPSFDTAERFVASGEYFWNSGIFVWKVKAILAELEKHQPAIYQGVQRVAAAWSSPQREEILRREYEGLTKISIDFAIMERAAQVFVVQAPYQWDDVGSWLALERMHPQDEQGNTILATHAGLETRNCLVVADEGHLIATLHVQDLLIVQDGQATLVADRRQEGAVKQLVEVLKKKGLDRYL